MTSAHRLDCEASVNDCRFIVQSENEEEALDLARRHMKDVHGQEITDDELRETYLQAV